MNEVEIYQAGIDDIDTITEWRMEVLAEVFGADAVCSIGMDRLRKANIAYYKESLSKGNHIACFARCGNDVIGCGGVCFQSELPSPDNPSGRCAYLMNIYVRKNLRGNKIWSIVVRWLIDEIMKRNVTKIYLETSKSGYKMYQALGFADMKDMMIYDNNMKE